jgi:hypothetical protein
VLKYLKISISALALSAFVVAPLATFVSSDAVYAKSENGGGKSGGGKGNGGGNSSAGKGHDNNSKAKSNNAKAKGNKTAGKSHANKSFKSSARSFKSDLGKLGSKAKNGFGLFGGKQKQAKASAKSLKPTHSARPPAKGLMHPRNLGKMNGVLNSSPKAKLAHIANGNFNGPVGLAAALAVADYNYAATEEDYAAAIETLDLADAFEAYGAATSAELDAAQADIDLVDAIAARDVLADTTATEEDKETAQQTLDNYGPLADDATAAKQTELQDALRTIENKDEPTKQQIADASQAFDDGLKSIEAVKEAEKAVLGTYKGELATSPIDGELSDEEKDVLGKVRDTLPKAGEVADALQEEPQTKATEEALFDDEEEGLSELEAEEG